MELFQGMLVIEKEYSHLVWMGGISVMLMLLSNVCLVLTRALIYENGRTFYGFATAAAVGTGITFLFSAIHIPCLIASFAALIVSIQSAVSALDSVHFEEITPAGALGESALKSYKISTILYHIFMVAYFALLFG